MADVTLQPSEVALFVGTAARSDGRPDVNNSFASPSLSRSARSPLSIAVFRGEPRKFDFANKKLASIRLVTLVPGASAALFSPRVLLGVHLYSKSSARCAGNRMFQGNVGR